MILAILLGGAVALEPVVVTATRTAAPAFEVPASIDSVSEQDLDANKAGINLSEVLAAIPGVLARDRQNYAQDQQISIRGFGVRAPFGIVGVRLYVDGVPATMPDGQGQVSHFNLDSAQRIEILRGPFSALYGNAAGGVIQVFTAPGTDPPQLQGTFTGGSYGTTRDSLNARGIAGPLNYNADYTHFQTDGYREHSAARRESGNARLEFNDGADTQVTLVANTVAIPQAQDPLGLTRAQFESDPRMATPQAAQFNTRKSVQQTQTGLIASHALGPDQSVQLTAYYGERAIKQFLAIPVGAQANPLHSGGVVDLHNDYGGGYLRWRLRSEPWSRPLTLVAGLSYDLQQSHRRGYENFIGSELGVQGNLRRDEDDTSYDLDPYLQADWDVSKRWRVLAGVRQSRVHFRSEDHYVTGSNPDDSGTIVFKATTPVAGLLYRASDDLHLYASFGKGFDTPTFNELAYQSSGASGLNTTLRPARSDDGELGAKWRLDSRSLINAALFDADTRDEIVVASSSGGRTTYQNGGSTRRRGAELEVSTALAARLHAQLAYTWLDTRFRASGNPLPGVPKSNLYAALRWGFDSGWNAAVEGSYLSQVAVNSANSESAPAYALLGVNGGYAWDLAAFRLRAYLRLDNALDRRYAGSVIVNESNQRYYEPGAGRNALAGLELRWSVRP